MRDIAGLIKSDRWWQNKAAPVLAQVYLLLAIAPAGRPIGSSLLALALFLLAFVGVAAYGHLVNDLGDLSFDARAGKANALAGRPPWLRAALLGLSLGLGLAPWAAWPWPAPWALYGVGLQLALLTAYALPPVRLKTRSLAGVLTDALYAYVVPALITWAAWSPVPAAVGLLAPLLVWASCAGLRGILNHQLLDLSNDLRSGVATLATQWGPERTLRMLASGVLPAEMLALGAFCLAASWWLPLLMPAVVMALAWRVFQLAYLWEQPLGRPGTLSPDQRVHDYGYRLLDHFYTDWLPVLTLLALVLRRPDHLPLLLLHLAMFRTGLVRLVREDLRWVPNGLRKMMRRHGP